KLREKYKDLMKEIIENGTGEFVKHFSSVDKNENERLVEFITDQMLSHMEMSKRFNKLSNFFIDSLNFNKDDLLLYIRLKLVELFDAERVTLCIYDQHSHEFYTIVNFVKYSESANDSYFQEVLKNSNGIGVYNK